MKRVYLLAALLAALGLAGVASALDVEIEYEAPPAKAPLGQAIGVTFEDARPPDDGGGDPKSLGEMKTAKTFYLETEERTVEQIFVQWVVEGLRAAGYDARAGNDPALPRVHLRLEELMAYGYTHFEVPIDAQLQLYGPGGTTALWTDRLYARGGVTLVVGPAEIVEGFNEAFQKGFSVMDRRFNSAEFTRALGGTPAAAPAAVATAPAAPANTAGAPTASGATTGAPPPPPPAATPPPPPPPPAPRTDGISIPHIDDSTAKKASKQLRGLCGEKFEVEFVFYSEDDDAEWTLKFWDEDDDDVGYVNLDDEDTIEFDGDDEDCDCDSEEDHKVRIKYDDEEVTVYVDGEEILEEDIDADDDCVSLSITVHEDMYIREFEWKID